MKTYLDCIACFVRQSLEAARLVSDDPALAERVLRDVLAEAAAMRLDEPPPLMGQRIHRFIRQAAGSDDPYRDIKRRQNAMAMRLAERIRPEIEAADDPFAAAVRSAIAGNVIDLGVAAHEIVETQIVEELERCLHAPLAGEPVAALAAAVERAERVLYIADNAGEIALDRLLIERLPTDRLTLAVRGGPIINDVTREDAAAVGLDALVPIIDNGTDMPGCWLPACSASFRQTFEAADVVIAKGQGNYETLSDADQTIFFLLKVKCPVIARHAGVELGRMMMLAQYGSQTPAAAPGGGS